MYAKVADNWHKEWWEMLFFQGECEMLEHTQGKWEADKGAIFIRGDQGINQWIAGMYPGQPKGSVEGIANAHRICQCVNGWDELVKQRDALLEACKNILPVVPMIYEKKLKKAIALWEKEAK